MPVNDELIRQLNMAGLDHTSAKLLASKHDEMRVIKAAIDPRSPGFATGFDIGQIRPGEMLLGYLVAVAEPYLAVASTLPSYTAPAAPTLPLTIEAGVNDKISFANPVTVPPGTYTTAQELADLLNGLPDFSAQHVVASVVGGKLKFQALQFGVLTVSASDIHPVDLDTFGLTVLPIQVVAPIPNVHVLPGVEVPSGPTELVSAGLDTIDEVVNGLAQPSSTSGLFSQSMPLGYLPPGSDPLPVRAVVTDGGNVSAYPTDGSGSAFVVLWLLALD